MWPHGEIVNRAAGFDDLAGVRFGNENDRSLSHPPGCAYPDIVTGVTSPPSDAATKKKYDEKNETTLTVIGLTVSTEEYGYLREAKNGKEAWEALEKVYQTSSRANRISLKRQLFGYKHDVETSIRSYVNGITGLGAQLKSIKVTLTDDDIVDVLIFNLDETWSNIAGSLCAVTGTLSVADVTSTLIDEEARRGGDPTVQSIEALAMFGRHTEKKGGRKEKKKKEDSDDDDRVECYRCGKRGHIARNCWAEKPSDDDEKKMRHNAHFATSTF